MKCVVVVAVVLAVAVTRATASAQGVLISASSGGTAGNAPSSTPAISDGGRFVAFVSNATNLVANDTNALADVFLRDRDTDADGVFDEAGAVSTVRVSERAGTQANGPSQEAVITPDGRYVLFASRASNLFAFGQPPLPFFQVFRWERQTGTIELVSQNRAGEPFNADAFAPAVTADGNIVLFVSYATNAGIFPVDSEGEIFARYIRQAGLSHESYPDVPPPGAGVRRQLESPTISANGATRAYAVVDRDAITGQRLGGYAVVASGIFVPFPYPVVNPQVSRDGRTLTGLFADGQAVRRYLPTGTESRVGTFGLADAAEAGSPSGRYMQLNNALIVDFHYGSFVGAFLSNDAVAFDGLESWVAYTDRTQPQIFAISTAALFDRDVDGLNDHWEVVFDAQTPGDDLDGDGLTNAQEFARGTHPRGTQARFSAEGTSSATFFSTRYAIVNPGSVNATASVRFDADAGAGITRTFLVPARSRVTLEADAEGLDGLSFSVRVEGDQPLVVDRLTTWPRSDNPFIAPSSSHAEASTAAPSTSWLLAEGSTVVGFQLFYLLQNPQSIATTATIRFLLPSGPPVIRTYSLPAQSRTTVYVNSIATLESTDVSAEITATLPIAVERAMYRSSGTEVFALGHAAAAVAAPSANWLFSEGATGTFFDTYLLLANPSSQPASAEVAYLRDQGGAVTRTYTVPANSRFTVYVDGEPGMASAAFGTRVTSTVPIVAERAMYWAGGFFDYYEGHVSSGATQAGSRWVLAEGESFGQFQAETFVLIANTGSAPASVVIRTLPEGLRTPQSTGALQIPGNSRLTFPMRQLPGYSRGGIEVVEQDTATGALVVEGALYWWSGSRPFAAGASWPATRLQ